LQPYLLIRLGDDLDGGAELQATAGAKVLALAGGDRDCNVNVEQDDSPVVKLGAEWDILLVAYEWRTTTFGFGVMAPRNLSSNAQGLRSRMVLRASSMNSP
jgi:hypothetical protein